MNCKILLTLAFMLSVAAARAEGVAEQPPAGQQTPSTTATRAWMDLQSSGQEASKQPQPLSGETMEKIHKRYIDSFGKPIPEYYEHESFTDN